MIKKISFILFYEILVLKYFYYHIYLAKTILFLYMGTIRVYLFLKYQNLTESTTFSQFWFLYRIYIFSICIIKHETNLI